MRLVFSTEEFHYAGRPRPGFPILLGDDVRPLRPAQDFLIWILLGRGKILSRLTWEDYGRRLWDFFRFLHENDLRWDARVERTGNSAIARYVEWSKTDLQLSPSTINGRVRLIVEFYEWAHRHGYIQGVPFTYSSVRVRGSDGDFLRHARDDGASTDRPDVYVREWERLPEFLSLEQVKVCRSAPANTSTRLLFDLMYRVGLRSCEARTFPRKYVFNPRLRADCKPDQMIRVRLNPKDMWIKFGKGRDVDIPYSTMEDLHAYTLLERNSRVEPDHSGPLLVNAYGRDYTKGAVDQLFVRLSGTVGFRVRPLMLRHSYAIHTLARLRAAPQFSGEPLLYVRDRLGHASAQTTSIYLRQVNQLAGQLVLALEDEFDSLFNATLR